jgi:hypothetical protein
VISLLIYLENNRIIHKHYFPVSPFLPVIIE